MPRTSGSRHADRPCGGRSDRRACRRPECAEPGPDALRIPLDRIRHLRAWHGTLGTSGRVLLISRQFRGLYRSVDSQCIGFPMSDYASLIRPTRARQPFVGRISRRRNPTTRGHCEGCQLIDISPAVYFNSRPVDAPRRPHFVPGNGVDLTNWRQSSLGATRFGPVSAGVAREPAEAAGARGFEKSGPLANCHPRVVQVRERSARSAAGDKPRIARKVARTTRYCRQGLPRRSAPSRALPGAQADSRRAGLAGHECLCPGEARAGRGDHRLVDAKGSSSPEARAPWRFSPPSTFLVALFVMGGACRFAERHCGRGRVRLPATVTSTRHPG